MHMVMLSLKLEAGQGKISLFRCWGAQQPCTIFCSPGLWGWCCCVSSMSCCPGWCRERLQSELWFVVHNHCLGEFLLGKWASHPYYYMLRDCIVYPLLCILFHYFLCFYYSSIFIIVTNFLFFFSIFGLLLNCSYPSPQFLPFVSWFFSSSLWEQWRDEQVAHCSIWCPGRNLG